MSTTCTTSYVIKKQNKKNSLVFKVLPIKLSIILRGTDCSPWSTKLIFTPVTTLAITPYPIVLTTLSCFRKTHCCSTNTYSLVFPIIHCPVAACCNDEITVHIRRHNHHTQRPITIQTFLHWPDYKITCCYIFTYLVHDTIVGNRV